MVSTAYAAGDAASGSSFILFGYIIVFFIISYFFMIRPRQKKEREHQQLVDGLKVGDEVMTASGIIGEVKKLSDDYIVLMIAENVTIKLQKHYIANILPRGTLAAL